jgi:hypothetical protein
MENKGLARDIYIRHQKGKLWLEENGRALETELTELGRSDTMYFRLTKGDFDSAATISEFVIYISHKHKSDGTNGIIWPNNGRAEQPYRYLQFTADGTGAVKVANARLGFEDISMYYAIKITDGGTELSLDPELIIKKIDPGP